MDDTLTRTQAAYAKPAQKHYVGRPCTHCAAKLRYVSSGQCVACSKARGAEHSESLRAALRGETKAAATE